MTSSLRLAAVAACMAWFFACSGGGPGGSPASDAGVQDAADPPLDGGISHAGADGAAPLACDDGNPCTQDGVANGRCAHAPVLDGTPCNDGLRCTGDDRCHAGVCRGTDLTPRVAPRGSFFGYGAPPNEDGTAIVGLGEVVSDEHLLFAETLGPSGFGLSLVRVSATGLERLDTRRVDVFLERYLHGRDWSEILATFFIPLGADRTLLVGSRRRIELFDTASGKIESRASFALHPRSDSIIAGVGRGDRFYTCSLHALETWEIDAAGAIQRLGSFFPAHDCRSLSLSADGTKLLVASAQGIDRVDVSNPRAVSFEAPFAAGRAFWRVDANADFVVGQRQGWYGAIADIEVYRRSDLEVDPTSAPVRTFVSTGPTAVPSSMPLGFALLDGSVAVEWIRNDGNETSYTTELYTLPGGGPPARTFVHRRVRAPRLVVTPVAIARGGRHLIVPPWRTVLRDDPLEGSLRPLTGSENAGFEIVTPLGVGAATSFSGLSQHAIDLHEPNAPIVSSTSLPVDVSFLRWERNGPDALTAPRSLPAGSLAASSRPTPASCFTRAASGAVGLAGTVTVPGRGHITDLGSAMLQVEPTVTSGQFGVRWFEAPAACDGRTLDATVAGTIQLHPGDGRARTSWAFDGDRTGAPNAVIAETRRAGDDPFTTSIAWLEPGPAGTGWRIAAGVDLQETPSFVLALRVHGDRVVLTDGRTVFVARRAGTKIDVVGQRELERAGERELVTQILRFDGELVYLATQQPTTGVIVLRARDLEILARFETLGLARSMAEVGDRVVFGSANALDVADVVCPR